jgi:hypothetical protein
MLILSHSIAHVLCIVSAKLFCMCDQAFEKAPQKQHSKAFM